MAVTRDAAHCGHVLGTQGLEKKARRKKTTATEFNLHKVSQ